VWLLLLKRVEDEFNVRGTEFKEVMEKEMRRERGVSFRFFKNNVLVLEPGNV